MEKERITAEMIHYCTIQFRRIKILAFLGSQKLSNLCLRIFSNFRLHKREISDYTKICRATDTAAETQNCEQRSTRFMHFTRRCEKKERIVSMRIPCSCVTLFSWEFSCEIRSRKIYHLSPDVLSATLYMLRVYV